MSNITLENLMERIANSHHRIQYLQSLLQEEFTEVKDLQASVLYWEKNKIENGEHSHHITGRKCGCGKIHPYRAVQRDHS